MISFDEAFLKVKQFSRGILWLHALEKTDCWVFCGTTGNEFADVGGGNIVVWKKNGELQILGSSPDFGKYYKNCTRKIKLADDPVTEEEYRQLIESWDDLPEAFKEAVRKQQES